MCKIWANRLIEGTFTWQDVPTYQKEGVKAELWRRVERGEISEERYKEIIGEN